MKFPLVVEVLSVNYFIHQIPLDGELSLKCVAQPHTPRLEPSSLDLVLSSLARRGVNPLRHRSGANETPLCASCSKATR